MARLSVYLPKTTHNGVLKTFMNCREGYPFRHSHVVCSVNSSGILPREGEDYSVGLLPIDGDEAQKKLKQG